MKDNDIVITEDDMRRAQKRDKEWYDLRPLLGNQWAMFYVLLGAREQGKSYAALNYCLHKWKTEGTPFTWIRLSRISVEKMLKNKAAKFVDADLLRKYDLELTTKGMDVYDHGKPMAKILALSEMAKEKGVALFDNEYNGWYNIVCDEFQREKAEQNYFDVAYNFVGTMENLVRSRKYKVRIFLIANTLEDSNDILCQFDFLPETFGTFKLVKNKAKCIEFCRKMEAAKNAKERAAIEAEYQHIDFGKRCVIDNMMPGQKYLRRRKGTIADILCPNASNFTNELPLDRSLLYKDRVIKPTYIIKFTKDPSDWFTLWDSKVIRPYKKEHIQSIAMRPYIDDVFIQENANMIIERFDIRLFRFNDLIT